MSDLDFTLDVRDVVNGSGATLEVLPAVQLCALRADRPTSSGVITLTGQETASNLSRIKYVILWMSAVNAYANCRPVVRFFNDPLARGAWQAIGSAIDITTTDEGTNTDEIDFSGVVTASSYQWCELGIEVYKDSSQANSRLTLNILPCLKYS